MPKMITEKSGISFIEKKYLQRLYENFNKGIKFCKIDKKDSEEVKKTFSQQQGYIVSSNCTILGWE